MKNISGTGVALVTPFHSNGKVDVEGLKNVVNFCIEGGVEYLISLGTTSENATLNNEEQQLVNKTVITQTEKRVPLVIGIGGNCTDAVVDKLKTTDLSDFSAVLSVTPYYNKPTQKGLYKHFEKVSENSSLPVILYNVPSRTGCNMAPETVIELAKNFDNIIAIKEASGCLETGMKILKNKPSDFIVISGDDMTAMPLTLSGGSGSISVIANGLPKEYSKMIRLALSKKANEAYVVQYELLEMMNLIFEEGNPAGIKALLEMLGVCGDKVRLPLVEASKELKNKIKQNLALINS